MAINQNHLFEELNGVKCAIVEKNVSAARAGFLREILEYNRYTVMVIPSPPPKVASVPPGPAAAPVAPATVLAANPAASAGGVTSAAPVQTTVPPPPATFTVGVTDVTFNPVNAIFGRLLRTRDGHVVTLAYWQQKDGQSNDAVPYFY